MAEPNWEKIRKKFAVTREFAYFQSAGMSPLPKPVYKTICKSYKKLYQSGDRFWHNDLESVKDLISQLAGLTGSTSEDLIFVPSTSMAFSMVAISLKKRYGKNFNILTMQDEFPASNVPFEYQEIKVKYVQSEKQRYPLERIKETADENTRAIVCSYVQYGTGYRHNLEEIGRLARENGWLFIVNATQGFPIFPVDVKKMNIDVFSASLHKWGCAGHVGSLFFTSEHFRKQFPAPLAGWLSVLPPADDFIPTQKGENFSIYPDAMQYQTGTSNLQNLMGLKAAVGFMAKIGWNNISDRIIELTSVALSKLQEIKEVEIITPHEDRAELSGIISINLPGIDNQRCVDFLETQGVITTIRQKNIRVACNFFNNEQDIMRLADGLQAFINSSNKNY